MIANFVQFQLGNTIKKWTSYFDYVGVDARKPLFFGEGNGILLYLKCRLGLKNEIAGTFKMS